MLQSLLCLEISKLRHNDLAGDNVLVDAAGNVRVIDLGAATGEGDSNGGYTSRSAGTEFLITTGPAPAPSLDGENVVFGRVLKGMDVVTRIVAVPTFRPSGNSIAWNQVAEWLRDERAAKARESSFPMTYYQARFQYAQ